MPLDIISLQKDIRTIGEKLLAFDGTEGKTQEDSLKVYSEDLAAAIEKYVKTGTVNVPALGYTVAAAPGPVIGTAIGTIS